MKKGRRNHSAAFKARVAVEAIRGVKSMADLASEFEVHPIQIGKWKKRAMEGLPGVFSDRTGREAEDMESLMAQLYQQIGQMKVELDWLKKKHGMDRG